MSRWYVYLKNLAKDEEGQDIVEYALLLGLISIIAVVSITAAGTEINTIWQNVVAAIP